VALSQLNEVRGRVRRWNDDKGYGFVTPDAGGPDLFAHVSAIHGERRPAVGDSVLFVAGKDAQGRPRALHVRLAGEMTLDRATIRIKPRKSAERALQARPPSSRFANNPARQATLTAGGRWLKVPVFLLLLCMPAMAGAQLWREGVEWPAITCIAASFVSFLQYWIDKRSAQGGRSRVPENWLHLVELAGGWPGALLAQQAFRHKTRKVSYQVVFWLIVLAHQAYWIHFLFVDSSLIPSRLR